MTKEEKIKEAYGEDYEFIKDFLIGNGFFDGEIEDLLTLRHKLYSDGGIDIKIIDEIQFVRPLALRGIEHNRGWIKIETEADLPKDNEDIFVCIEGEVYLYSHVIALRCLTETLGGDITHYQPIEKPKPPIY